MASPQFSHEKLDAYQKAIEFIAWSQPLLESLPAKVSAKAQLERASTSIVLNIAEGNAKFSHKDRCRIWQIAIGSAMECAACLDVLIFRNLKSREELYKGKILLQDIVKLLMGLLNRFGSRISEDEAIYHSGLEDDDEDEYEDDSLI